MKWKKLQIYNIAFKRGFKIELHWKKLQIDEEVNKMEETPIISHLC